MTLSAERTSDTPELSTKELRSESKERAPFARSPLKHLPFQLLPHAIYPVESVEKALAWQENFVALLPSKPTFSICVFADEIADLEHVFASLAVQSYREFEVIVVTSAIDRQTVIEKQFSRFHLSGRIATAALIRSEQLKIALGSRVGSYILLLGSGAILHPQALFIMAKSVLRHAPHLLYSNQLEVNETGTRYFRRTTADRYSLLSYNFIGDTLLLSAGFAVDVLNDAKLNYSSLALCAWHIAAITSAKRPFFLPLALTILEKQDVAASESGREIEQLVTNYAEKLALPLESVETLAGFDTFGAAAVRVRLKPAAGLIQVVVPFRNQAAITIKCLQSLMTQSCFSDVEITLVNNNSDPEELALVERFISEQNISGQATIITDENYFNYARVNNLAIERAKQPSEYVLLLNNDVEVLKTRTLAELRNWCAVEDVGVVGGLLRYDSGAVQHAGINFLSVRPANITTADQFSFISRETNGVTFAMAMIKRRLLAELGGLDEFSCPNGFGDALFCQKAAAKGYRTMFTPFATGTHHESLSRGRMPEELELLELIEGGVPIADLFADCYAEKQPTVLNLSALNEFPLLQFAKRVAASPKLNRIASRLRGRK